MWNLGYHDGSNGYSRDWRKKPKSKKGERGKKAEKRRRRKKPNVLSYGGRTRHLKKLGFDNYKDYLSSDLWKRLRAKILDKYPNCYCCGEVATQVHHRSYDEATLLGERKQNLISICKSCHYSIEWSDGKKVKMRDVEEHLQAERRYRRGLLNAA